MVFIIVAVIYLFFMVLFQNMVVVICFQPDTLYHLYLYFNQDIIYNSKVFLCVCVTLEDLLIFFLKYKIRFTFWIYNILTFEFTILFSGLILGIGSQINLVAGVVHQNTIPRSWSWVKLIFFLKPSKYSLYQLRMQVNPLINRWLHGGYYKG